MDEELLYANFVLAMKFISTKQQSKLSKDLFYHSNLVLEHFVQCKKMFAHSVQVHKVLLNYYEQRWVLKEKIQPNESDSMAFMNQMHQQSKVNRDVCQCVVQFIIVGLNSLMGKDIEKRVSKQIKLIYDDLKVSLIFQDKQPTDILKPYVQKLVKEVQNIQFYENLLRIFKDIDSYSIISLLQKAIADFRQQWNKNQKEIRENFTNKKTKRENALISVPKQSVSLEKSVQIKENKQEKENNRDGIKTAEKTLQASKTIFKSIKAKPKSINPRQSFYSGVKYQFNPRTSTSSFDSSQESLVFEEVRIKSQQQSSQVSLQTNKRQKKLELIDEDCLCEGTPQKMKKKK